MKKMASRKKKVDKKTKTRGGDGGRKLKLRIYDSVDMAKGTRGKNRKGRYSAYREAIIPYLDMFKNLIDNSEDKSIRVDLLDIKKLIKMEKKSKVSIYWSLKYVMFDLDIVVTTGKTEKGKDVLVMRYKKVDDRLPESLEKMKNKEKEEE